MQKTVSIPNQPLAEKFGLRAFYAARRGARVRAENTYWAEPTLLSLFPSPLAGFVSSTSCCSSVIGAASGVRGPRHTSARLLSACSPSSPRLPATVEQAQRATPRSPPHPAPLRASKPGQRCGPPTWTRSSGRDWPERAWKSRREGVGRSEVTASFPNPEGGGREKGNLLN